MSIIGLLTDFGVRGSHYVAAMKAVILDINPTINIVDISHTNKPFSIIEASYLLKSVYSDFPKNSAFVVVIDPGVGSKREIVAIKTDNSYYFVGPDNGIFPAALIDKIEKCIIVKNDKFFHKPVSQTFHGRDIMSPVAAHICSEVELERFGSAIDPKYLKEIKIPLEINRDKRHIKCSVQYVDNFGNLTTNIKLIDNKIKNTDIIFSEDHTIQIKRENSAYEGKFVSHFASVSQGSLIFLKGSTGFLEISLNQGNASKNLDISSGDIITLQLK